MYKLRIRAGDQEFEAEGDEVSVHRDFELWRSSISKDSKPTIEPRSTVAGNTPQAEAESDSPDKKLYVSDAKTNSVSLAVLPHGDDKGPNSVLLILRGYKLLQGQEEIAVTDLKASLKQSGCTVDRVDDLTGKLVRNGYLNKGGRAKGSRYRITNAGLIEAKKVADALLG